jgi:two-component system, LuxR family, sensor kinase FixL
MSDIGDNPTKDSQGWASALVRPLSRRYLSVLASVAALVLVDQAILQPMLIHLNFYAPVINLAGRQRMLSQKVTKEVLALVATDESETRAGRRDKLLRTLEQWTAAHHSLLEGDPAKGIHPVAPSVAAAMHRVEPAFRAMRAAASEIASGESQVVSPNASQGVAIILEQDPIYLRGMEQVVAKLEKSAQVRVAWLRGCALIAMLTVIVLLVAVYFFVLQPAANLIRRQVERLADSEAQHRLSAEQLSAARDELELRVAQRTYELSEANVALEREMADREVVELRMRELSTELAHASRVTALGQLATGLAHEINQPLATVSNYAGTLELTLERQLPGDQEARLLVSQIKQAALRAGAIVRRMRSFVRSGVPTTQVGLNELLREVAELCQPEMHQANVHLMLHLTPRSTLISADALQIQQVLVNLIQNAIQAIVASAAPQRELRVTTDVASNEVCVTVADSGPGFPAGGVEKCFESFYSTKSEGLGMGLAISRTIIQQHQGRIWSENREAGGALVGFSLPLLEAHDSSTDECTHRVCG